MNVDTPMFYDLIFWCADSVNHFAPFGNSTVAIPRIMGDLEKYFINIVDHYSVFNLELYNLFIKGYYTLELKSMDVYRYFLIQQYSGLIHKLSIQPTYSLETNLYQPHWLLVFLFRIHLAVVVFYTLFVYFFVWAKKSYISQLALAEGGIFLYAYLDELEEECGQIEDYITYLMYLLVFVLWFYLFNIFFSAIILKYLNWIFSIVLLFCVLGFAVPSTLLLKTGLSFLQYVRGAGKTTSLFFETLLDFVSTSVIVIRFLVQNIRFVFILVGFFEYYEFIEASVGRESSILPHITWASYWRGDFKHWYWFEVILQLFTQLALYLYYVGHLTITYLVQLTIYVLLSFWVFFFLYTTFVHTSTNKYFFYKRCALQLK